MNEQYDRLEPVDPTIREQLTRRSSGRLPDGLATQVSKALAGAGGPRSHSRWPSLRLTAPRLAGTALGIAFVAVLAVALVAPALRSGPGASAGYPYGRALTTDELVALMANPPAINTALVVTATIDVRNDVCPMNRYPTAGVIHGVTPQICVMQSGPSPQLTGTSVTGTFAVRYLGPGYVGLLGQITPASGSQIPFRPTDEWPVAGKTFLVEGWLGADELMIDCSVAPSAGDPLSPNGFDCQYDDWLGDASTAPGIGADHVSVSGADPSYDPMSLRGDARHVEAGGMRLIDSLNPFHPVHGVYVVRSITEQCPNVSPQDSRGCGAWLVMARVPDLALPTPTGSETPTTVTTSPATPIPSPSGAVSVDPTGLIGPNNTPLTQTDVAALMNVDQNHLAGRYVVEERIACDGTDCSGVPPRAVADMIQPDGSVRLVGPLDLRPDGGLVWTVPQALGNGGWANRGLFIVDASMISYGDGTWLDSDASAELTAQIGAFRRFAPAGTSGSMVHGFFLVRPVISKACMLASAPSSDACTPQVEILARLEPAPWTSPSGSGPLAPALTGIVGPGGRPLTSAELNALWAANPSSLVGRIAIVKGPVPLGGCPSA